MIEGLLNPVQVSRWSILNTCSNRIAPFEGDHKKKYSSTHSTRDNNVRGSPLTWGYIHQTVSISINITQQEFTAAVQVQHPFHKDQKQLIR